VARAVSMILDDPAPHIGQVYNLTGFESADPEHYARVFSEALGGRVAGMRGAGAMTPAPVQVKQCGRRSGVPAPACG
jgi:uncharacterized protein YbjT (DUF2867 family)